MEKNTEKREDLNLGGFPPIFFITSDNKKKREFKEVTNNIDNTLINKLNILNIKNILGKPK
jgi:hypothetical protein